MRKSIILASLLTSLCVTTSAMADDTVPKKHKWVGVSGDIGVPDGAAIGVVVSPYFYWLKANINYTNNYFASGGRAGITLDPIKFFIGPTFTTEYGFSTQFNASHTFGATLPGTSYEYVNLQPGIELGSPNGFRFFVRGGVSSVWIHAYDFNQVLNSTNVTTSDPKAHLWLAPTFKLGFTALIF